ncbi:MAG: tetratricopeptide repeat protein, partial [Planctomycetes bacterium]|nr:tetratricopeptide repeat protein [Planctomycetota bacterium]
RTTAANPSTPVISDRYAPRATPRTNSRPTAPAPRVVTATPPTSAPRLLPRANNPRSTRTGVQGRLATGVSGRFGAVHDSWGSWWDPCHSHSYNSHWYRNNSYGWHAHGGCGSFGFSWSLWAPWWYCQNYYWGLGYSNCWWNTYSQPSYAYSSYWWYPSSSYCPTYLYVPSTVLVVEEAAVAPAAAPAAVGAAPRPGVGDRSLPPLELARKYVELGDFYFKAGRFPEAADAYARARTYAPDDASVHLLLADAAFATGDYHFAAFLIGEAVRLDPSLATADTDKRLFYGDPKLFETQMQGLDDYLASKPYDALAHLVRGYNLRFSGQPAGAVTAFRRVLEIAPDNRTAATFLSVLAPVDSAEPVIR